MPIETVIYLLDTFAKSCDRILNICVITFAPFFFRDRSIYDEFGTIFTHFFENEINSLTREHPIESYRPEIAHRDRNKYQPVSSVIRRNTTILFC